MGWGVISTEKFSYVINRNAYVIPLRRMIFCVILRLKAEESHVIRDPSHSLRMTPYYTAAVRFVRMTLALLRTTQSINSFPCLGKAGMGSYIFVKNIRLSAASYHVAIYEFILNILFRDRFNAAHFAMTQKSS